MYIYPNTDIYLLNGVSLNADYDHTIYFTSLGLQSTFFLSHTKYSLSNNYYVRKERGYIQVEKNQNDLWDCTYMMYRNTSYKNKWFYAFITSVDYVNDNVSLIHFEIDVIQTWWSECILDKCFVEREHSSTDNLFENTVDENLDLGDYYNTQILRFYNLDCTRVCIIRSGYFDVDHDAFIVSSSSVLKNYFTGLDYLTFDLTDSQSLLALTQYLDITISHGYENSIVSMFQYPRFMGDLSYNHGGYNPNVGIQSVDYSMDINTVNVDGYTPKNKKLFTHPYNFVEVDNGNGDVSLIKLEQWDSSYLGDFQIIGTQLGTPKCMCYPLHYNDEAKAYQHGLVLQLNIENPWLGDAYQVWLAQNRTQKMFEFGGGLLKAGVGVITGFTNPALGASQITHGLFSAGSVITDMLAKKSQFEATPRTVYGQAKNDILSVENDRYGYTFRQKTIRNEYARIIDEYFSRYGYACHRIKVPNRNARQNWTYVKTVGCEINGNIPSDDLVKIKAVYDHGITFWNNGNNIGNYGDFTNPVYS